MLLRSSVDRNALFSLYATQCLGLVSFACLVFGIVHRLAQRRRTLAGCMAMGLVLASTPLIYPWRYITIVGGDNPILWTGQSGRQIGIIAPWAALLLIGRQRRATTIAIGLATAGLAFTSLQSMVYVLAAVSVGIIWRSVAGGGRVGIESRRLRGVAHVVPIVALATIVYAFWWLHQAWVPTEAVWWLLAGAVIAMVGAVAIGFATEARAAIGAPKGRLAWAGVWVSAVMGGLLLSNNSTDHLFGGGVRSLLSSVLPGYGQPLMARADLGDDVLGNLTFPSFSRLGCGYFNYCVSFGGFLSSFGFLFVVALATWFAFGRLTADASVNARRVAWLLLVAALSAAIMVMFFIGAETAEQSIVFSRLLDVPYYGLLGLAALTFTGSRDRVTAIVGTGVLTVWTLTPLIGSQWPEQMVSNGQWVLDHAGLS